MLDLVFIAFIGYVLLLGLRRPFLWVLLYVYIDILAPQQIGYSIITSLPVSLIAFAAAFGGWLVLEKKEGARFSFRQLLLLVFLCYCWWTLQGAEFQEDAQSKWDWVWKALLFAIFLPLTLTTRLRLEALALTVLLSVACIVISTGLKTVLGGGGYESLKFFVDNNSGIYESSTLATIAIGMIPMVFWFMKYGTIIRPHWTVSVFGVALIFASLLIPIGTEARTGLLCIAALGVLLLRFTEKRLLFVAVAGMMVVAALPFLPQSYYDRMATIAEPGGDQSASTRVAVWTWTIDYAAENPMGGGFDSYRANRFTYVMPVRKETANTTTVEYQEVIDEARAFHSSIFEVLGEQGYPGLVIWLTLHLLGVWQMEMVYRRWRSKKDEDEGWIAPMASALQMASLIYFVGSLFQGIAYQPAFLMIVGLQIGLYSYVNRVDAVRRELESEIDRAAFDSPNPKTGKTAAPSPNSPPDAPGAVTA